MIRKKIIICVILVAIYSAPISAQTPGDLNCNGFMDVLDLVHAVNLVTNCEMSLSECARRNGDVDGDGRPMTISDFIMIAFLLTGDDPPDFTRNPDADTIMVESAIASPGETIALPLWVKTIDTLVAFQFLLEVDTDYIEFDTVIVYDDFPLGQHNCDGNIYCHSTADFSISPILLLPGNYHIADIIITINPENDQPATTSLIFSSIPPQAMYSGFANLDFFLPVMVDAEIEIVPATSVPFFLGPLPKNFDIYVHPNPFNANLNIRVHSINTCELTIYDILGRSVRSFGFYNGTNTIRWDASNDLGQPIKTGIYFVVMNTGSDYCFKKILYLK